MARILVVDNYESVRQSCKRLLKTYEHEVVATADAVEALWLMGLAHFDLIISDYHMPKMSGLEFLLRLREKRNGVPFILHSNDTGPEVGYACKKHQAEFWKKGTPGLGLKVAQMLAT